MDCDSFVLSIGTKNIIIDLKNHEISLASVMWIQIMNYLVIKKVL